MLLLVDGYNVTMRDDATKALSKEQQRESLIARLAAHSRELAHGGKIVAVFDAHAQLGSSTENRGAVTVAYAADADTEIVRRAEKASGQVTVATDDLRLRARISQDVGRHVRFIDGVSLSQAGVGTTGKRKGGYVRRDAGLPAGANEITQELKELWLTEDEK